MMLGDKWFFIDTEYELNVYNRTVNIWPMGSSNRCKVRINKSSVIPLPISNVMYNFDLEGMGLTDLTNCPKRVEGYFSVEYMLIRDLSGGPEYVNGDYYIGQGLRCLASLKGIAPTINGMLKIERSNELPVKELIPLLFTTIHSDVRIESNKPMGDILTEGRVNGKMPRELIPGKINELRDLGGV